MVAKISKTNIFLKKKILISGSNGFIGRHFFENLSKDYEVYRLNLRFNKKSFSEEVEKQLPMSKIDIYFHLSFDKRIISTNYRFINIDCLKIIYDILKKRYKDYQFFYISSLNVLLEKYYDKYTKTKLEAEKKIFSYKNIKIIRVPLVISKKNEGDISKLSKYVNIIPLISLVPYKGSIINYITIDYLITKLPNILFSKEKIINIYSGEKIHLEDLAKNVS